MASHMRCSFFLLIVFSLTCLQSKADGTGSVFFLDSSSNRYFRPRSSDANAESNAMSLPEVGAAVSVLLGFAPPATLSAASSSKLNQVLMPNPFDRPHSVFMLELIGAEESQVGVKLFNNLFDSVLWRRVVFGESKADIQLSDEDDVSVVSLNEPLSSDTDAAHSVQEICAFASWLGASYVADPLEPMNGELTILLPNRARFTLHMSKQADRDFVLALVSLVHNIQRAIETHQDLSQSMNNPAELLKGRFDGIKTLQEQYGMEGVAQQGLEVLFMSITKIFDSLLAEYKGRIVGVILSTETPPPGTENMLNVMYTSLSARRWMEEKKDSLNSTVIAEVVLVRRTLAWITGIILIVATLLGIHFLLNMPLTRDTLLYSNVKLD